MDLVARIAAVVASGSLLVLGAAGCSPGGQQSTAVFPAMGSLAAASGKGSFRFGASTAATQIEEQDTSTDEWTWSAPAAMGGLAHGTPIGDASMGYARAVDDVKLLAAMHLDAYRFSMEWSRIEPKRDEIDEAAIAHYRAVLVALRDAGIRPLVTVHHFASPIWIADPRDPNCMNGPTSDNLCGLGHPQGGALVVAEMEQHAKLLAQRFGDLVDEWGTLNDPVTYLLDSYGVGSSPPGHSYLSSDLLGKFVPALRDYLEAHARMYAAIKANDTVDADGDGSAADVGLSLAVMKWQASAQNVPSTAPADVKALERATYLFHYLVADALRTGVFDADFDGTGDEHHPTWKGTLDWLGLQYYARVGVTGTPGVVPVLNLTPCLGGFDFGACVPAASATWWVPSMKYEFYVPGVRDVLGAFSARYPTLPLVVTESGLPTRVGRRRAEAVVRVLEQIQKAREGGVDVRGYYHASLLDGWQWGTYEPRFGLYAVDIGGTYDRTATEGATVLGQIAAMRAIDSVTHVNYGGEGPMTPDSQ